MSLTVHHLDKWASANTDYIEEILESQKKAIVVLAGASSSGKSFLSRFLEKQLITLDHKPVTISLDQYNVGLSAIIPNKVNLKFYGNQLQHMDEIRRRIKKIIFNVPFDQKYTKPVLRKIKAELKDIVSPEIMDDFLSHLYDEWKILNFDESTVYDLKEAAEDVRKLCDDETVEAKNYSKFYSERTESKEHICGKDYDVIIVEGIYALNESFLSELDGHGVIRNFVDSNAKSLFLRRIIRDRKATSADSLFTISAYFRYIVKEYIQTIQPTRNVADIVYVNDMSFAEMKRGTLFTAKTEIICDNKDAINELIKENAIISQEYQKDIFFNVENERDPEDNILRLRCLSPDQGQNYIPSSLVHKGYPKFRMDGKKIRPINVFIREGEFHRIWKDSQSCAEDFIQAGFIIGSVKKKIKTKLDFHGEVITIREIENGHCYIEYTSASTGKALKAFLKGFIS